MKKSKALKKRIENLLMLEFYLKSELPFFSKNPKDLTNYQLSKELPFFPKRSKRLTKHQILKTYYRFMTV